MSYITTTMDNLIHQTAFFNMTWGNVVMILVACVFLYLAIAKEFEPLLLVPIAFGMLLVNIYPDIMLSFEDSSNGVGGLLYYFYKLDEWAILPSLIFMGVGAMTDFGPLIANPKSFLLGAAAQFGIFAAYFGAIAMGFNDKAAAAISIIGGADGPTSIFLCGKLGQTQLLGPIAVAAYSYMSLVPIIQPPIMKLLTTEKERKIKMEQLRPVTKLERILFPIIVTIVVCLILPTTAPLVGMLMLGNLFRESGVVRQLADTASNALMYIVVILLGTSVGATTSAEAFLNWDTIKIVVLGLIAFAFGTAAGVLFGKLMCKVTHGKVNPLIGSAGVSAVPMAARVSQKAYMLKSFDLWRSYANSIFITVVGTLINMLITTMAAYVLSKKDLKGQRFFMFLAVFTMMFTGGIIPTYIVVKDLHLMNSLWAMILPSAVNTYNLIILRNFFLELPMELEEAALLDGCTEIGVLFRIMLPISKPALTTVTLFYAVDHWNDFFSAIMYINKKEAWPLQLFLRSMLFQNDAAYSSGGESLFLLGQPMKMAAVMLAIIPIMCAYPFFQKYFTAGMTAGAVKG